MKADNNLLLVKIQPTIDDDPTPDGSNVVVMEDLDHKPYEGNTITRNRDRPFYGAQEQIMTNAHTIYSFSVELAQASAAGTVPAFGPLLRACGMAEVIVASTSVTYTPVSKDEEQVTVYQIDDQEQVQKTLNCKGSFGLELNADQLPKIKINNLTGSYKRPETLGSAVTVDESAWEDAVPLSSTATQTATIGGYNMCLDSLTYESNTNVNHVDKPGCKETSVSGRSGGGTLVLKAPSLTDKDIYADLESHVNVTKLPLTIVHGDSARPNLTINMPLVQLTGISKTEINGDLYYSLPYQAIPSAAGNDEIELIF